MLDGFSWFRVVSSGGFLFTQKETFRFINSNMECLPSSIHVKKTMDINRYFLMHHLSFQIPYLVLVIIP
jgi:hypothetical protein